jgi:hypothetical protein
MCDLAAQVVIVKLKAASRKKIKLRERQWKWLIDSYEYYSKVKTIL